ncbi:S-ribosylhomocysteine lyase [Deinococcus radiophilus]|uniref:S-ribosylhomocysteine lyase n=1 Tax=Deinococcus radiophilus TaxID=32062 RepID=A0A3S0K8W1_9DEIO|nr:S-ribosylhomocysteine lyase [Deinococcus radiophilus]RTR25259.1 S-ribosylhomocysteine lyase [Deinococcus radiophilus]UFA50282.1 S-ribosylhomocysteine lyase [Deinococcus radiophilus]
MQPNDVDTQAERSPIKGKVESFDLDHTQVKAPYVRLAGTQTTPGGDTISKYDLRLLQPNQGALPTGALHTLEHLLVTGLRGRLENVVDVSPMGCRTGFYMAVVDRPDPAAIMDVFRGALEDVATYDQVPAQSELECGNARDHDLEGAKRYAAQVLDQGLHVQESVYIQR